MAVSLDLLINAIVAGILLGGFYAAVTVGITITFGMLDIANIAQPAFILLGSYAAYIVNGTTGLDPILIGVLMLPVFFVIGMVVYQLYYYAFELRGEQSIQGLAFFFGLLFVAEVSLILAFGVDYRFVEAPYIGPSLRFGIFDLPLRMLIPFAVSLVMVAVLQIYLTRSFIGRAILAVSQDALALRLMAARPDPDQADRLRHFDRDLRLGRRFSDHHPAGRAVNRARLYRPHLRDLRARRNDKLSRHGRGGDPDRHRRKHHRDVLRSVLGAGGSVRFSADHARRAPGRAAGALKMRTHPVGTGMFWLLAAAVGIGLVVLTRLWFTNEYFFFAAYVVLQYIVLATAWNILGGYTGYINFGTGAFFAIGAYSTVVLAQSARQAGADAGLVRDRRYRRCRCRS